MRGAILRGLTTGKPLMNSAPRELPPKKRQRVFRFWLITAASLFLVLLTLTQFLPGGTRTFSDWLPALFFLLAVSLSTASGPLGLWLLIRPGVRLRLSAVFSVGYGAFRRS